MNIPFKLKKGIKIMTSNMLDRRQLLTRMLSAGAVTRFAGASSVASIASGVFAPKARAVVDPATVGLVIKGVTIALNYFKSNANPTAETIAASYSLLKGIHERLDEIEVNIAEILKEVRELPDKIKEIISQSENRQASIDVIASIIQQEQNICTFQKSLLELNKQDNPQNNREKERLRSYFRQTTKTYRERLYDRTFILDQYSDLNAMTIASASFALTKMGLINQLPEGYVLEFLENGIRRLKETRNAEREGSLESILIEADKDCKKRLDDIATALYEPFEINKPEQVTINDLLFDEEELITCIFHVHDDGLGGYLPSRLDALFGSIKEQNADLSHPAIDDIKLLSLQTRSEAFNHKTGPQLKRNKIPDALTKNRKSRTLKKYGHEFSFDQRPGDIVGLADISQIYQVDGVEVHPDQYKCGFVKNESRPGVYFKNFSEGYTSKLQEAIDKYNQSALALSTLRVLRFGINEAIANMELMRDKIRTLNGDYSQYLNPNPRITSDGEVLECQRRSAPVTNGHRIPN